MPEQTRQLKQAPSLFPSPSVTERRSHAAETHLLRGWFLKKACVERSNVLLHTTVEEDKRENSTFQNSAALYIVSFDTSCNVDTPASWYTVETDTQSYLLKLAIKYFHLDALF